MTRQEEIKIIKQSNLIDYLQRHGHKKIWQSEDDKQASFKTPWKNNNDNMETFLSVFFNSNDKFWRYTERYGNERHQVVGDTGTVIDLYCKMHNTGYGNAMQKLRQEIINNPGDSQAMEKPLSTQQDARARTMTIPVNSRNTNLTATGSSRNQTETTMEKTNSMPTGSRRLDPSAETNNRDHAENIWLAKTNHPDAAINCRKQLCVFSSQQEARRWQNCYPDAAVIMAAVDKDNYPQLVNLIDSDKFWCVNLVFTDRDTDVMTTKCADLLHERLQVWDGRDYYDEFINKIDMQMMEKYENLKGMDVNEIEEIVKKMQQAGKTKKELDEELGRKIDKVLAKEKEMEARKIVKTEEEPAAVRTARIFNRIR